MLHAGKNDKWRDYPLPHPKESKKRDSGGARSLPRHIRVSHYPHRKKAQSKTNLQEG